MKQFKNVSTIWNVINNSHLFLNNIFPWHNLMLETEGPKISHFLSKFIMHFTFPLSPFLSRAIPILKTICHRQFFLAFPRQFCFNPFPPHLSGSQWNISLRLLRKISKCSQTNATTTRAKRNDSSSIPAPVEEKTPQELHQKKSVILQFSASLVSQHISFLPERGDTGFRRLKFMMSFPLLGWQLNCHWRENFPPVVFVWLLA